MKHLTKENILLVLVSLLVLAQVNDMRGSRKRPEKCCAAVQERGRDMVRKAQQGPRVAPQRDVWLGRKKAEGRGKKTEAKDQ